MRTFLATLTLLLVIPAAANAASTITPDGDALDFDAAAGIANDLTVTAVFNPNGDETITFSDPADVINVDAALTAECAGEGTNTVTCTDEYPIWFVDVGDLDDDVTANGTLGGEIFGDTGEDTIVGSDTNQTDEEHFGGDDNDALSGRGGSDELTGDDGNDSVSGGPGDDFLYEDIDEGNDSFDGGEGNDEYEMEVDFVEDEVTVNLTAGTAVATSVVGPVNETNTVANFEDVDLFSDEESPFTVTGTDRAGAIYTDTGNDVIAPLAGADFVLAGGGNDAIDVRDGFADIVRCDNGTDTVQADQHDVLSDCENVTIEQRRAAGADLVAPTCTVTKVKRSYSRAAFLKGFRPDVDCNEAATLEIALLATVKARNLTAKAGDLVLAERTTQAGTNVRVKPAKKLAKRLRRSFKARLVIEARDEFGNRSVLRKTVRVKPAKAKRKRKR